MKKEAFAENVCLFKSQIVFLCSNTIKVQNVVLMLMKSALCAQKVYVCYLLVLIALSFSDSVVDNFFVDNCN